MPKTKIVFLTGLGLSFLPIWRAAPDKRGLNAWEYMAYTNLESYQKTHIPYDEAVDKAGDACGWTC